MELNREQIVKALKCCKGGGKACLDCIYFYKAVYTSCAPLLIKDALSLINKLTEENERLRADNAIEFTCVFGKPHKVSDCPINDEIAKAKAKTVRKMQERLKANRVRRDGLSFKVVDFEAIDRVAAEMLGGE